MTPVTPRLAFGGSAAAILLLTGDGYLDDAAAYDLRARTNRVAPAGASGECIVPSLYLVTVHEGGPTDLHLTPYVDGAPLDTQVLTLAAVAQRTTLHHELALSVPVMAAGIERGRIAPRGTWVQLDVATAGAQAMVRVDAAAVEVEVVQESMQPGIPRGGAT